MEKELKPAKIVDVRGTICPGALWEMLIAYKDAKIGDIIAVYSSDPSVKNDAPAWVDKSQNELVGVYDRDGYYDIVPGQFQEIKRPDIVILEGLNVLQTRSTMASHHIGYLLSLLLEDGFVYMSSWD